MKEMTPQEIVKNSDYIKSSGKDWKKVYAALMVAVQQNIAKIVRSNNSLFLINPVSDTEVEYHVFNADPKEQYKENLKDFMNAMRNAGFTTVTEA